MTGAPGGGGKSRPRVRLRWRTSKPPEPSSSSRAWTLTTTSSPTAIAPVSSGYATQAFPSTSQRTRPSCSSAIAVTVPRRRLRVIARDLNKRECHVDHPLEVRDRDPLVRRVDVGHPVGEVHALEASLVEDVRVGTAAAEAVPGLDAGPLQRGRREAHRLVVALEPITPRARIDRRLDVAFAELGRERDRLEHLLHQFPELAFVVAASLGGERAALRDDVPGRAPLNLADVGGCLLVKAAEPEIGDRTCSSRDGRAPVLGVHARMRGAAVERGVELALVRRSENHLTDRPRVVIDVAEPRVEAFVIERLGTAQPDLFLRREQELDPSVGTILGDDPP